MYLICVWKYASVNAHVQLRGQCEQKFRDRSCISKQNLLWDWLINWLELPDSGEVGMLQVQNLTTSGHLYLS